MAALDAQALREWYDSYMAADGEDLNLEDPLLQGLSSDSLDTDCIEQRICDLAPGISVEDGHCSTCRHMLDNWPLFSYSLQDLDQYPDGQFPWKSATAGSYQNTASIEASARQGCKFCALLLQALKDGEVLETFRRIEGRLDRLGERATASLSVGTMWDRTGRVWLDLPNKLSTRSNSGINTAKFSFRTIAEDDVVSEDQGIFEMANCWLRTCCESHKSCNPDVESLSRPTRLVSIANGKPRVEITADMDRPGQPLRYATLSYCWGTRPFIKLTKQNFQGLTKVIPTEDVPPIFADAVTIAKALEIDYIWIDSLCIVQDDDDDWRKEADRMQAVYSGSYVNIAAASATDVYGGCFVKTPSYFRDGVQVKVTVDGTHEFLEFGRVDTYDRSVIDTHLMTRGWAIQEKLLAPRTLHFGSRGVFWECRERILSESLPKRLSLPGSFNCLVFGNHNWKENFWEQLVMLYGAANLTYRQDRFPALAGIARAIAKVTGDEYVAGLWRRNIELHLCWHSLETRKMRRRPRVDDADWVAPSWSWASMDGVVQYPRHNDDLDDPAEQYPDRYAHVFDTEMTFSGPRPFGQLRRGVVYLRCSVIVAGRLRNTKAPNDFQSYFTESVSIDFADGPKLLPVDIDCEYDSQEYEGQVVYLVPLVGAKDYGWSETDEYACPDDHFQLGLVLRKTNDAPGEFCRIGFFEFHECPRPWIWANARDPNKALPAFRQAISETSDATARAVCAEVVSNTEVPEEKYVITLV
ncbi:HET-domain-containing protein [Apiospora hydei]|uniref:HET-domain-containing protein n=1 Tax=Apiospora hydei TaxID=1337664 RepID=A0ABR1VTH9_9PEZI